MAPIPECGSLLTLPLVAHSALLCNAMLPGTLLIVMLQDIHDDGQGFPVLLPQAVSYMLPVSTLEKEAYISKSEGYLASCCDF